MSVWPCDNPACSCCHPPSHYCDFKPDPKVGEARSCETCGAKWRAVMNPTPHPKIPDVVWRLVPQS